MNVKNVQEAGARSSKLGVGSGAGDMCPGAEAQWRLRSPSAVAALWCDKKSERSGAICLEAKGGTKVTIIYDNSTHLHSREKGRADKSGRLTLQRSDCTKVSIISLISLRKIGTGCTGWTGLSENGLFVFARLRRDKKSWASYSRG